VIAVVVAAEFASAIARYCIKGNSMGTIKLEGDPPFDVVAQSAAAEALGWLLFYLRSH
jgi:hypothetical protein